MPEDSMKKEEYLKYAEVAYRTLISVRSLLSLSRVDTLLSKERNQRPKSLLPYGFKAYSQNDEDGILQEVMSRLEIRKGTFIEFGCGHGFENNTAYLLVNGWSGLWMDGDKERVESASRMFGSFIDNGQLRIAHGIVNCDNINELIAGGPREPDLLSIDIDMNDYWVWKAINSIDPRVVVIEYNAILRPPLARVVPYQSDAQWGGGSYFGASLSALQQLGATKNYSLVGCNLTGVNAFFVRNDLVGDKFLAPFTAENHYNEPEYNLFQNRFGHHRPDFGPYEESS